MDHPIEGGCLCGAIRYRATAMPIARSLCHCRTCQRASAAPSVAWVVFNARDFAFTNGQPALFHSSPNVARTFCGRCGTPLSYQRTDETDTIDITTVSLEDPDAFAPTKEIWLEHKRAWETLSEATRHYPRSSVRS
jgi:hypothetical protein